MTDGGPEITFPAPGASRLGAGTADAAVMQRTPMPTANASAAGARAATSVGDGSTTRSAPRPLRLARSVTSSGGPSSAGPHAGAATIARPGEAALVTPSSPTVQASRAETASAPGPITGITATPVVQRVDGAAPSPASHEGHSDSELDELAQALFGRIRTHLRAEVIHEREAKGLTFDAF